MDNLTHSLIGAAIGQTGLKKLSGLGMATLVIAANMPDIDAASFFWLEGHENLGFRRGITHGLPAMIILPALLTAAMVAFDRWQGARGKRPATRLPVRPLQLYVLALIGCLSHPAFDWLNNYGIRLLEPFSSRWFYGDTLFIIDVWLWAGMTAMLLVSLRRERQGRQGWDRQAAMTLAAVSAYVFANGVLTGAAERDAVAALQAQGVRQPLVVASPPPLAFWRRDIFWRDALNHGQSRWVPWSGIGPLPAGQPHHAADPRVAAAAATNDEARAFLFWSRMPVARFAADGSIRLTDQRYSDPRAVDRFTMVIRPAG